MDQIEGDTDEDEEDLAGEDEVAGPSSGDAHSVGRFMYDISADDLMGSDSDY